MSDDTVKTASEYKTVLVRMRPKDVEWLDAFKTSLSDEDGIPLTRSEALHVIVQRLRKNTLFLKAISTTTE